MAASSETKPKDPEEDVDADALLEELENEDDTEYRAQRLQQIQSVSKSIQQATNTVQSNYITLKDDDEALKFTTEYQRAVVHFFHPDFARCSTMDAHLQEIASKHAELGNADLAFGRIDVKNAPFVVEKLAIRILPCVLGFVKGATKGRVTGFEGVAWNGKENGTTVTRAIEGLLVEWGALGKSLIEGDDDSEDEHETPEAGSGRRRGITGRKETVADDEDDWD